MRQKSFTVIMSILLLLTITSLFMQAKAITWSVKVTQLTNYTYYDGFPAFAHTSDGRIWFVWSREIQGNLTLYYKISRDQGRTWSVKKNLTEILGPGNDQNPSIIQAQNGTIWVTWTSDRPEPPPPPLPDFYLDASPQNITIPQGESENSTITVTSVYNFSEAVDLSVTNEPPGVTTTLDPTQVTPPPNGTATSTLTISVDVTATPGNYTLTTMGRAGKLIRLEDIHLEIVVAGGGTSHTSADIHTSSPSATSPSSAIEDYEIYYKTSHDKGQTWSKDLQLTSNGVDDLCPAIAQLTNGTIMIAWQSYTTGNPDIFYKTTADGVSWSDTKQLTTDSANDKAPALTQTKDGKIWVVWASTRNGDYEIYYKTYDGITWSGDLRLTTNTKSDIQPAIVQAIDENMMIFWASSSVTGTFDIYYKISSDNGSTWSDRIEFVATGYEDVWPAVMRARDTRIWVAWYNNEADQPSGNWEIYFRTSLAGDVNEDNQVNVIDLTIVSLAYGTMTGEPGYNPVADINKDGFVEMRDLVIVAYYLGET